MADLVDSEVLGFPSGIRVLRERGISRRLSDELSRLDRENPLIVTDSNLVETRPFGAILSSLDDDDVEHVVFDGVQPNPSEENVQQGSELLRQQDCDCVVGIGGGSSMDTAKAIGMLATNGGSVTDYEGIDQVPASPLPTVAVPTTVGTGSEVTQSMVITDSAAGHKRVVISDRLGPDVSLLDPGLLETLPSHVVATTGIDSLTQAIEAYITKRSNPLTEALSISAVEIIGRNLRDGVEKTDDDALERLQIAATMQGTALTNSGLGLVHGLANTVGGRFETNHGATNAALLPHVLEFNMPVSTEKYAELATALGVRTAGRSDHEAATAFVDAVVQLLEDVDLALSLEDLGVERGSFDELAESAMTHVDSRSNPRNYTKEQLVSLYEMGY